MAELGRPTVSGEHRLSRTALLACFYTPPTHIFYSSLLTCTQRRTKINNGEFAGSARIHRSSAKP